MSKFYVKSEQLLNYTLALQKINDIALPIAVQNSLNAVARDIKKRTLKKITEQQFDINKKTFFQANSGYKTNGAKDFNYNVNKLKAEIGITKGRKSKETATEQVGNQQTATPIKRSINPLGTKPQTKANIDILSQKPEVYDSSQSYSEGNSNAYIRKAQKAYRNKSGLLIKNGKRGALNKVMSIKSRKPTKKDPRKMLVNVKPIASYIKDGHVKLKKRRAFLNDAAAMSMNDVVGKEFIKEARKQIDRAMRK